MAHFKHSINDTFCCFEGGLMLEIVKFVEVWAEVEFFSDEGI